MRHLFLLLMFAAASATAAPNDRKDHPEHPVHPVHPNHPVKVPEPETLALFGIGLVGVFLSRRNPK
jgi:hypothetical protein